MSVCSFGWDDDDDDYFFYALLSGFNVLARLGKEWERV